MLLWICIQICVLGLALNFCWCFQKIPKIITELGMASDIAAVVNPGRSGLRECTSIYLYRSKIPSEIFHSICTHCCPFTQYLKSSVQCNETSLACNKWCLPYTYIMSLCVNLLDLDCSGMNHQIWSSAFLLHVWDTLGSNLGPKTRYLDFFKAFLTPSKQMPG